MVAARRNLAVVLSDIHIGSSAPGKLVPTCWYQPYVHDAYLTAALEWIVHNPQVRDVVLLGDVFDVWTYPPWQRPPTMREIIDANKVLSQGGPFYELVKAFPQHVSLMLGNHDGTLTSADIDMLNDSLGGNIAKGEALRLITEPALVLSGPGGGGRTLFSHGHHWCMFNAPDEKGPWHGLPLGHVISRAIAYQLVKQKLAPGQTSADLPGQGNPTGVELRGLYGSFKQLTKLLVGWSDDIATPVVNYICKITGMPLTERIVLPDGSATTPQQAKADFEYLFKYWANVKEKRRLDAERAALADQNGKYLAWFAQREAMRADADLVVLGHTHSVIKCLDRSPVNYVNSGYECVSKPDLATNNFTFTVIDLDRAKAQLHKVVVTASGAAVLPADAPAMDSPVVSPAKDFSCYLRIVNRTGRPLELDGKPIDNGSFWAVPPPKRIENGKRVDIWLQDQLFGRGAAGAVAYTDGVRAKPLTFRFGCPVLDDNSVSSSVDDYETRAGDKPWRKRGPDPKGSPLQVRLAVPAARYAGPNGPGPASPHVTSAKVAPPPMRQLVAASHADYLKIAAHILQVRGYPAYRGKVLTHARLLSADANPLVETESAGPGKGLRFKKDPPAHLLGPTVYEYRLDPYGTFQYVLIHPTGAAPPVFGGFLFLPSPGSLNLNLVTFNVSKLDVAYKDSCRNDHHAEMQVTNWIDHQPKSWQARIGCLTLTNDSRERKLRGKGPAYSPCNHCCDDLGTFLGVLKARGAKVAAAISWGTIYDKGARCGHPTTQSGIDKLTNAGWKIPHDPLPLGARVAASVIARPGDSPCLDPALSTR
jgi:hypothetical protein